MRIEIAAWLLGSLLALAGALAYAAPGAPAERQAAKGRTVLYLACAALACVVAGLAWRSAQAGTLANGTPAEGLAVLAGGALGCLLWPGSRRQANLARGLIAAGAILLTSAVLAWNLPAASPSPQARTWLFGLRNVLAGLGLGGWPVIGAAVLEMFGRDANAWRRGLSRRATVRQTTTEGGEAPAAMQPADGDREANDPAALRNGDAVPAAGASHFASSGEERIPVQAPLNDETVAVTGQALAALRFSYPWLTAAIVAASLWNAVAFATPWRSRPGDLWLVVTWMIGAACLHLASRHEDSLRPRGSRIYFALLGALALCGLAAALLAALQAPSLFS